MTDLYVRVMRDGRPQSVEIEDVTAEEWQAFIAGQPIMDGWTWARALAVWIRVNVHEPTMTALPLDPPPGDGGAVGGGE